MKSDNIVGLFVFPKGLKYARVKELNLSVSGCLLTRGGVFGLGNLPASLLGTLGYFSKVIFLPRYFFFLNPWTRPVRDGYSFDDQFREIMI